MCFTINLSEDGRNRLGIVVAIFNFILFLAGISLILLGIYVQVYVNDELILLESYSSGVLPNFIVSVGTIMFLLNLICAKIAYDSGFDVTRDKYRMALLPTVVLLLLFCIVIMSAGITCLSYRKSVEEALHDGLMDSMKRYKENRPVKITLDKLQMFSRCCGSRSYKDWFLVSWIDTDNVDKKSLSRRKIRNGNFYIDNVPFSCCDVKAKHSCVTDGLQHSGKHKHKLSIYRHGCTESLMNEMENKILHPTGTYIMILFAIQFVVFATILASHPSTVFHTRPMLEFVATFLLRYLQTSIEDAYLEGDTAGPGKAYFCPDFCPSCLTTGDPNKYIKKGALDKSKTTTEDSEDSGVDNNDTIIDMEGLPDIGGNLGNFGDFDIGGGGKKKKNKKGKEKDSAKGRKSRSKSPKSPKKGRSKAKKMKKVKKVKKPKMKKPKLKKPKFKKPKFKKPKFRKKRSKSPKVKKRRFGRK